MTIHAIVGGAIGDDSEEELCEAGDHLKQGAHMKVWEELGQRHKRRESQKAVDEIKKVAVARNVEPEKIAGTVLHRLVYKEDKNLAGTAKKIELGEPVNPKQALSVCHGIWFVTMGGGFGKKQYRSLLLIFTVKK